MGQHAPRNLSLVRDPEFKGINHWLDDRKWCGHDWNYWCENAIICRSCSLTMARAYLLSCRAKSRHLFLLIVAENVAAEIKPAWIEPIDQRDLLGTRPFFELFLAAIASSTCVVFHSRSAYGIDRRQEISPVPSRCSQVRRDSEFVTPIYRTE